MDPTRSTVKMSAVYAVTLLLVFLTAGALSIYLVNQAMKQDALREAHDKSRMLLDHNLAVHSYLNKELKPAVFRLSDAYRLRDYFDPTWMSSTFAVRGINKYSTTLRDEQYYYKECAINARSPENEADAYERSFIEELNRKPDLIERSEVRMLEGKPYFVVMRRGESMEDPCLQCHSVSRAAPAGLVEIYGPVRSFNRKVGEVVSAVSIRIPLDAAYGNAKQVAAIVSTVLVALLLGVFMVQLWISNRMVFAPLERIREKAAQISNDELRLGEQIPEPAGQELREVTTAFNRMSSTLRNDREHLEEAVAQRTQELQQALDNVKTLRGMIPICSSCKKIRDDAGYWNQVEVYIREHSEAEFTHGICPDCVARMYPGLGKPAPEGEL